MRHLYFVFLFIYSCSLYVCAQESDETEFNQEFLGDSGQPVTADLNRFRHKNTLLPGQYLSDIYVNGQWIGRQNLLFQDTEKSTQATVCFNESLLRLFGVDFTLLPEAAAEQLQNAAAGQCLALPDLILDAQFNYDANALRADISIPQYYVLKNARGYIHPKFWDEGVTAATIGYQLNTYRFEAMGKSDTTYYMGLNNGINFHGWRLRNQSVMTKSGHHDWHYQTIATYLKHDVTALHSQFLMGDAYTPGALFDSVGFRGLQLSSDDRMLPDSMVGYAPVVRGVAKTNAKVAVFQQDMLMYETTVSPGAFEINDLYATGQSGDLTVVVTEANGEQYQYTVPNLSFTPLLREGATQYDLTLGKTRETDGRQRHLPFIQIEGGMGINNVLTGYGGALWAAHYHALAGSLAFSTAYGAFSVGGAAARAMTEHRYRRGHSFNVKYSHQLPETDTSLSLAAYHYFSPHYYELGDVLHAQELPHDFKEKKPVQTLSAAGQQHQLQFNISQHLGEQKGTLFLSGSLQRYWGNSKTSVQYLLGYSNNYGDMSYQLMLQRQRSLRRHKMETQIALTLSFPLGKQLNAPTMSVSHYQTASPTTSVAVNGTIDQDNIWSYGISASRSKQSQHAALSTQYRSSYALLNGSYGYGHHYTQLSGNISGGIVLHPGGVTLAQSLGESVGVIEAKGAAGAKVNSNGVYVDRLGYAVVPFLTPYRMNQVELDPKGTSLDVELMTTSQRVTPRAGSVVMLTYPTLTGRAALIFASVDQQYPVPFGAEVFDEDHHYVGTAGQGGNIFVRGLQNDSGVLTVRWNNEQKGQCTLAYTLPPKDQQQDEDMLTQTEAVCTQGHTALSDEVTRD